MRSVRLFVIIVIVMALVTCTNPMLDTVEQVVQVYNAASYELSFPNGDGIAPTSRIQIVFGKSMELETMELDGSMVVEGSGIWSSTNEPDDTFTFSPKSEWSGDAQKTLAMYVEDLQSYPSEAVDLTYWVLDGTVYVHSTEGNDLYPGTREMPKRSIGAAVETAEAAYDEAEIRIAEGQYQITDRILISKSVAVVGGFDAADWSMRNPVAHETVVQDMRASGSNEALSFELPTDGTATIDGLTVIAAHGRLGIDGTAAVFATGGRLVVRDSRLVTAGTAERSYGIAAVRSELHVERTRFVGTSIPRVVLLSADESEITVRDSTFSGARLTEFIGLSLVESTSLVERNVMDAQEPTSLAMVVFVQGGSATLRSNLITAGRRAPIGDHTGLYGVYLERTEATLQNNTIDGGAGVTGETGLYTTGVLLDGGVTSVFQNNIIFTAGGNTRTGVWQKDIASLPTVFKNNNMHDCPDGNYYHEPSNTGYVSTDKLPELEEYLISGGAEHVSGNSFAPAMLSDVGSRPTELSPEAVKTGGLDLSDLFSTDIEGTLRTGDGFSGWSMGAYEYIE